MSMHKKTIQVQYYAVLREQRGCSHEQVETEAQTPAELYEVLKQRYGFHLPMTMLKVVVNETFQPWDTRLADQDQVVFIPPVAGG